MNLSGWGRFPVIDCDAYVFETESAASALLNSSAHWIARGLGKSYGDSSLNQKVLLTSRFDKLLDFDPGTGVVKCESGVTLSELIDVFLPRGWFLKVTPGTKLISVGGAIASDVHGKNHHVQGCFSSSVRTFRLLLPDGQIVNCGREQNRELFRATCGGMGLTGLILDVDLQLIPVSSAFVRERVIPCRNLRNAFEEFEAWQHIPYTVAWIDCLAKGERLGRSVLMLGDHAEDGDLSPPLSRPLSVPFDCPSNMLNTFSVALFNRLYYYFKGNPVQDHRIPLDSFFYPLDKIVNWNRIYGTPGFTQYQFVLPKEISYDGLRKILEAVASAGMGSFLAVLKLFGTQNDNLLSFPMEGYTLALDFKIQPKLFPLLDRLDAIVLDHGGRLYLSKDCRMPPRVFAQGYPRLDEFRSLRERYGMAAKFSSLQSRRLEL